MNRKLLIFSFALFPVFTLAQDNQGVQFIFPKSKSNKLYSTFLNRMELKGVDISMVNISSDAQCPGGITRREGYFDFALQKDCQFISVKVTDARKSDSVIATQLFQVYPLPKPGLALQGKELKGEIAKELLTSSDTLEAFIDNDIEGSENWFKLVSFEVVYYRKNAMKSMLINGDVFPKELKKAFRKLKSGDRIIFDKVIQLGPANKLRPLSAPVALTIK